MSFVTINNTSIKISNIKNFGVSSTTDKFIDIPIHQRTKNKKKGFFNAILFTFTTDTHFFTNEYYRIENRGYSSDIYFSRDSSSSKLEFSDLNEDDFYVRSGFKKVAHKPVTTKYLYITTFQNDNYQFYDDQIDVEKEHQNLLRLLN